MPKFTNNTKKAVFVPNPNYQPDAPDGSPLVLKQRTIKVLPGQSVDDVDAKIAKELTPEALAKRTKDQQTALFKGKKMAKAVTRDEAEE